MNRHRWSVVHRHRPIGPHRWRWAVGLEVDGDTFAGVRRGYTWTRRGANRAIARACAHG